MYQVLLTRRYLFSKIMPLLAALAVMLITATELVTWSVMGGFLNHLIKTSTKFTGDVSIQWPSAGFAHYDELIEMLEREPEIRIATPVIQTFAMVRLPEGRVMPKQVWGIDPDSFSQVANFRDSLWWKPITKAHPRDFQLSDPRLNPLSETMWLYERANDKESGVVVDPNATWEDVFQAGVTMSRVEKDTGRAVPAAVVGIEVLGFMAREGPELYLPGQRTQLLPDGTERKVARFGPMEQITVTMFPVDSIGRPREVVSQTVPIANEFHTGVIQIDKEVVLLPLSLVQRSLQMNEATRSVIDPIAAAMGNYDAQTTEIDPARVTDIVIRAADGYNEYDAKEAAERVYKVFASNHIGQVPDTEKIQISTYEEQNAFFISAVRKETALVMFIFGVISFTSVFLVLAIFWSMISEKTKDIGVLRSIGAGRKGIAGLWISYGFLLGMIGSMFGVVIAILIVRNINPINDWIGKTFGKGAQVWNPDTYYLLKIPNEVDPMKVVVIFVVGVFVCVLGSAWPAIRAARMDPVRSLRFE
ncbi:MAG: ABC transporter permease [Phycisphaeraceae bacterium]|nr:ABC transporter permease [Phycisphaerales bacterium]MCB9860984.1 ABC transporter permease [Phycisphaeraceae bacterium]